jgi:cyclohexadieny/prephenate dehydrogenase
MTAVTCARSQTPLINKIVIIGIGLIGGSLATGLKKRAACAEVIGIARRDDVCVEAVRLGVVDRAFTSIQTIAGELGAGDIVFISVPTLAVAAVLAELKLCLSADVVITDGASVKGSVERAAIDVYGQLPAQLVLGHPIAGSEKSGVTAANPDLYVNHRVIITPVETNAPSALALVTKMWQAVGAEVLSMSVAEHDDVLAATSHLPHAIAYSLVDTLAQDIANPNIFRCAAGGFRDFTRIASSDPVMWHDIMRANKHAVLKSLDLFIDNLMRMRAGIENEDGDYLLEVFSRAKEARDEFTQRLAVAAPTAVDKSNAAH